MARFPLPETDVHPVCYVRIWMFLRRHTSQCVCSQLLVKRKEYHCIQTHFSRPCHASTVTVSSSPLKATQAVNKSFELALEMSLV